MKIVYPAAFLLLTLVCAHAKAPDPEPSSTVAFRGEELPVYAPPHLILPKKSVPPNHHNPARKDMADAKVMLRIFVDTNGKVAEVEIISSEPEPSFGVAARTAALQWRYEPLKQNGKLTRFVVQQPINFKVSVAGSDRTLDPSFDRSQLKSAESSNSAR